MENKRRCTICKIDRELDQFVSKAGRTNLKNCLRCRTIKNQSIKKCEHGRQKSHCKECGGNSICSHGRRKSQCKECGGSSICEHGRQKPCCKECGGNSICEHGRQKQTCKECGGSSICEHGRQKQTCKACNNPKQITIKNMIRLSRQHDIENNRYDANNFIDKCFIHSLIDESTKCYYWKVQIQFIEFNSTLCMIECLDNTIGHIKSNCVLACRTCNVSRVGQRNKLENKINVYNEPIDKIKPSLKCNICTKKFKTFSKKTPFICQKCIE